MRNHFISFFVSVALVGASTVARAEDTQINIGKINGVLASLLKNVLQEKDGALGKFFTRAEFVVSEKDTDLTSPDSIKIRLGSRATARGAAWTENDTTLRLELSAGADRLKKLAYGALRLELETDTKALFNFAAEKLAPEWCTPRTGKSTPGSEAVCELLTQITSAGDLTEIFGHLVSLSSLATTEAKAALEQAKADLAKAKPEEKPWLERRLKNAEETAKMVWFFEQSMKSAFELGKGKQVFKLSFKDIPLFTGTEIPELELYLDSQKADLSVRLVQRNIKDIDQYFAQRTEIEKELLKLQNGDAQTLSSAQKTISFFLQVTEDLIGKQP